MSSSDRGRDDASGTLPEPPAPTANPTAGADAYANWLDRNLYTWPNYKNWADQVRDSWQATDSTGASGAGKPKK